MVETTASKPTSWRAGVELVVTALFWGIWIYFILPLVSLMMWVAGIFIFVDHMILLGGYQSFLNQLLEYGLVILGMMAITLVWINWNIRRYGSSNKRSRPSQSVTHQEIADFAGVSPETIKALHRRRHTVVYFDDHDRLVVANAERFVREALPLIQAALPKEELKEVRAAMEQALTSLSAAEKGVAEAPKTN